MAHWTWQDIIALVVGLPAIIIFMLFAKDVATPPHAPKSRLSLGSLLMIGSIWRSGGRS